MRDRVNYSYSDDFYQIERENRRPKKKKYNSIKLIHNKIFTKKGRNSRFVTSNDKRLRLPGTV